MASYATSSTTTIIPTAGFSIMTSHDLLEWFVIFFVILSATPLQADVGWRRQYVRSDNLIVAGSPGTIGFCESIVIPNGYKCQELEVETQDGYILSMQRIPEGRLNGGTRGGEKKQPVLLQHGVLMDGMTWLLNSPEESLAFVLADNGYDVWIANIRGTRWSQRHVSLDSSNPVYWAWSWDELAAYDLPTMVDFVYQQTGQKLHYVGHSMGTLIVLASLSERRLVDKLKSAALLSPVAYLTHMKTPLGILAARAFIGEILTDLLGMAEFNPKGEAVSNFMKKLCYNPGVDCYDLMSSFTGNNCCLNESTVEIFLKYEPQPTSTKNLVHLAQTFRDGVLTKYNYENTVINIENYGQSKPPVYNLSSIPNDFPLFISYGGQDSLADTVDVGLLLNNLKFHDGNKLTVQFVKDFAHADFVMGVTATEIVYNAIMAFFKSHEQ